MKLKVLNESETPENCNRRVMLKHDDSQQDWVRDTADHTFVLWSNCCGHRGDRVFEPERKEMVDVESPFEHELDADGCETGGLKERDGLIVIPVDVYEHSGRVWFLRGEAPAGCNCPLDSTCYNDTAPFFLYVDQARWEKYCGSCKWSFRKGKPTKSLLLTAYEIARAEIREMNLHEGNCYYGYCLEERNSDATAWNETDSSFGYLTDEPAKDVDFELGCPVVADDCHLVGDTFEQECWALIDDKTGRFMRILNGGAFELVDDPVESSLMGKRFLEDNWKNYENRFCRPLTPVDVTLRVWSRFPECFA